MKRSLSTESERQQNTRSHLATSNVPHVRQGFVDNRVSSAIQRQLMVKMTNSPQAIAQRQFSEQIHSSPRMTAQRWQMAKASGGVVQRVEGEEELLQGKFSTAQLAQSPEEKQNNTGLPDNLKQGIENLSGMSMDGVKVHYNSSKPVQLNALAYAQGTDIHVGVGQEKHLPHEAWHVVQQAQGRVKPTMQMREGVPVNDDQALEHEADVMGAKALMQHKSRSTDAEPVYLKENTLQKRQRSRNMKGRATRDANPTQGLRENPGDREGPLRITVEQGDAIPNCGVGREDDVRAVLPDITTAHMYAAPISTQIDDVNGMRLDQQQAGNDSDRNLAIQNNIRPRSNSKTYAAAYVYAGALENNEGEDKYALRMVRHALKQSNRDRHLYRVYGKRAVMSPENKTYSQQAEMDNVDPSE